MYLLNFDIEEFDMPFEYGKMIPFEDQIEISSRGTHIILDLLQKHNFKSTFFSTVAFAEQVPGLIQRIKAEGHELGSHSYYHSKFQTADLLASRLKLEELSGMKVKGFRMPRMRVVNPNELESAGYEYNSSINPTWLPGRYNNLNLPRTVHKSGGIIQIPASVSPHLRIPLFWLSMHNFPLKFYLYLLKNTHDYDGYINVYFHPWEFTELSIEKYGMPGYVQRNSGDDMIQRMDYMLQWIGNQESSCISIQSWLERPEISTLRFFEK